MAKSEISLKQITYTASTMIIATSILTKQLYTYAKNQGWIAVCAGTIFCLLMIRIYASLLKKYPGLSLIEINDAVYGRYLGKAVSALYIYFFLTIACLNVNIMGNFVKAYVLPNTPMLIITLTFTFICGWAARKGSSSLMSYGFLITFISIVILIVNTSLLVPSLNLKNLLPVYNLPIEKYALSTHTVAMIPLSDTYFLLMFHSYVKNTEGFGSALSKGLLIGAAVLMTLVLRDTAVLGGGLEDYVMPSYMSIRMIDIGDIFTRIDIVFILVIIVLIFYKVTVLLFATVSSIERATKSSSYRVYIRIITVLLTLYAVTVFTSESEHTEWLVSGAAAIQHTFFMVVLPAATWVVSAVRGNSAKNGEMATYNNT